MTIAKEERWFHEWEGTVFGCGYGSGEISTLGALKDFFKILEGKKYDYHVLEKKMGERVTWLLINALGNNDIIEWGTSARYGWLTSSGILLKNYVDSKSVDELYKISTNLDIDTCHCDGGEGWHSDCGKNPFINESIADKIIY